VRRRRQSATVAAARSHNRQGTDVLLPVTHTLIHLLAIAACYARYGRTHSMFESPSLGQFPITPLPGWGLADRFYGLGFVVLALYPLCRWFAGLKQQQ
jgi:hypothetical protein